MGGGRRTWRQVLDFALRLPGAYEDHPWGESVAKVNKKVFVFMGHPEDDSANLALSRLAHGLQTSIKPLVANLGIRVFTGLLNSMLSLYFTMVLSRLLGLFYWQNRRRLRWF